MHVRLVDRQQLQGAVVDGGNPPALVQTDHPSADAGQNCLDEQAAGLGVVAGRGERGLLALKIPRHAVEGSGQVGDLARSLVGFHSDRKVACSYLVGRLDQPTDRRRDRARRRHAQPHGPDQHQQRRLQIAQRERGLDARAALLGLTVALDGIIAGPHPLDQAGRQRTHHIEVGVAVVGQKIDRANHIGIFGHRNRRLVTRRRPFKRITRRRHIGRRIRHHALS